jgi:putative membrane protein
VVIVDRVKEELGCEVLVAHGISTHERDLTRSDDNDRVAEALAMDLLSPDSAASASPMVWAERTGARASCQLFGDAALVTLSLSPKSYDDLPNELRERIVGSVGEMGLDAVVVDSHNSIRLGELEDYDPGDLHDAAMEALKRAAGTPRQPFSVGAARVVPTEWGLDDGLGPCGIAALAVRLEGGQTSSYIVVDGNNMLSGLREKIIGAVRALGVDEAEVMTSDIHLVNAIGKTTRGYHPIGERIDDGPFISYVVEAVEKALSRLGRSGARHTYTVIPGLTVPGSGGLSALSHVLESGFGLFKKTGLTVMPMAYLLSVAVLYFL